MRPHSKGQFPALTFRQLAQETTMTFGPAKIFPRSNLCRFVPHVIVYTLLLCQFCVAQNLSANDQLTSGSSSKKLRQQTLQSIPFNRLNVQTREKITDILEKPSMYRRLPVTAINADPDHFRFLIRYPEVIVNIWQLMGVTKMETERTGPYTIKTNDGAGTVSSLELVYGTDDFHIFYGTGSYEGPVLKRKLTGECVLVVQSTNQKGRDSKLVQTSQLDVFLKVNNATAGLIARTIQPLVGSTADHNFVESLKFVQRLNDTTEKNGPGVQQMSKKLNLDPQVRKKYIDVVDLVFQRAINNAAPGPSQAAYPQPAQPSRAIDSSRPTLYQNRAFQAEPPVGAFQYLPPAQSRQIESALPRSFQQQSSNNLLPAHGYQAPVYAAGSGLHNYRYQQSSTKATYPGVVYGPPYPTYRGYQPQLPSLGAVQAQYQNYGTAKSGDSGLPQVQHAGGWRGR